ncbi:hypothetical protein [Curtobacterium sp. MCBD17_040]|uniref:hypothetical protein n=1 Tax=Curtobacterium sp. MCBD17_040 TaxID=2175674 RepID=UPI000DAA722A|nr:hypothetical protein [Curtobacterium sp. MCBD17_040]WIB65770.1 hypothetical protein DEI94_16770 [Curtobacterium sp. MCBD17_040]
MKLSKNYNVDHTEPRHLHRAVAAAGGNADEVLSTARTISASFADAISDGVHELRTRGINHDRFDTFIDAAARRSTSVLTSITAAATAGYTSPTR